MPEFGARRANVLAAQGVARLAGILHRIDPVGLRSHARGNSTGTLVRSRKLVLAGNLQHRIPIHSRIILRRRGRARRGLRGQLNGLSRHRVLLVGIDEPIAACPDLVFRRGQFGNDEAAEIIGDHHLGVFGRKIGRLRDHPDAGFGAIGSLDLAPDGIGADDQLRRLSLEWTAARRDQRDDGDYIDAGTLT